MDLDIFYLPEKKFKMLGVFLVVMLLLLLEKLMIVLIVQIVLCLKIKMYPETCQVFFDIQFAGFCYGFAFKLGSIMVAQKFKSRQNRR